MSKHPYPVGTKPAIERLVRAFEIKRDAERRFLTVPWGPFLAQAMMKADERLGGPSVCVRNWPPSPVLDDTVLAVLLTSSRQAGEA